MFQRLKGAIDNRIAEEQARQRQAAQQNSARTPQRRRPQNPVSAARSPAGLRDAGQIEKGPDPKDFEPEFVVGDADSKASSIKDVGTDAKDEPAAEDKPAGGEDEELAKQQRPETNTEKKPADTSGATTPSERAPELPTEVRTRLRKLDRLESKYGELLKAYRAAHTRVQAIEPFEASLRENTPLTSISDPSALVEYLNQNKLKGDMVLDELKRISTEKDDLKKKFEQSEKENAQLKQDVQGLKKEAEANAQTSTNTPAGEQDKQTVPQIKSPEVEAKEDTPVDSTSKSRLASFSLFSPKLGAKKDESKEASEDLFSYDSEVPRLEQELQERMAQVDDLNRQVESLRTDLKVARESTEGMMQTLEERTKELGLLRDTNTSLDSQKAELERHITELEASASTTKTEIEDLQRELSEAEKQKAESAVKVQEVQDAAISLKASETDLKSQLETLRASKTVVDDELLQKDKSIKNLEESLDLASKKNERQQSGQDSAAEKKVKVMNGIMEDLRNQLDSAQKAISGFKQKLREKEDEFARLPSSKVFGFLNETDASSASTLSTRGDAVKFLQDNFGLTRDEPAAQNGEANHTSTNIAGGAEAASTGGKKKNNKKKKKGTKGPQAGSEAAELDVPVKVSEDLSQINEEPSKTPSAEDGSIAKHLQVISDLESKAKEQETIIDRLSKQLKDQDALKEEIETLRDDLLHQGGEHVEARDALKQAQEQSKKLQDSVDHLETVLADARKKAASNVESEAARQELETQFQELKEKFAATEKDLKAAEQLAAARFKDITDLKELLTKAQPELRSLRAEVVELKRAKDDLKNKQGEFNRLEAKHEDLKAEMKGLSKRLGDKDSEIKELQQKIDQEARARSKVEDELTTVHSDLRVSDNRKKEANERSDQLSRDLAKAKEDASGLRSRLRDLEDQVQSHKREVNSLKEEVSLKTALHTSSQALVQSLRDQTHELSTQTRETSARTESLEEELAEAQRMLSERTRESQTMRMLLNQAETGTESRIREMKERMDSAIEERDRVEDEANVTSRRMMREVEDAKVKARDAQRQLKAIEDERDELESKSREWRRRREELERTAEHAQNEVDEVQAAMKGLRDALDDSERQIRDAEQHKQDLRKQSDDANERIEKLTRANKNLTDEIKALQQGGSRKSNLRLPPGSITASGQDSGLQSSRTSMESSNPRSPPLPAQKGVSRTSTPTVGVGAAGGRGQPPGPGQGQEQDKSVGLSQATVDIVYLKNVLLQFLERKDKGPQIIPVLGMLLNFNQEEEQKFTRAVSAR